MPPPMPWTLRNIFAKLIGITPECTRGDKIIIYSVFGYSLVYGFGILFIGIVVWNLICPWPESWWTMKFFITTLLIPGIVAVISTVWFIWGGIRDMKQLFADLENRKAAASDNGQVLDAEKKSE